MPDAIESTYPMVIEDIAKRVHAARMSIIDVHKDHTHPFAWVGCEIALLQLRKICELILLGSTLAHMHEGGIRLDERKWRPKDAFLQLDRVNEHPLPIIAKIVGNDGASRHVDLISQQIPFESLNEVYGICGDLLHVPTARNVLNGKQQEYDVEFIIKWIKVFERLAICHALMLPKREKILLCEWSGKPDEIPAVTLLEAQGESTLDLGSYPAFDPNL